MCTKHVFEHIKRIDKYKNDASMLGLNKHPFLGLFNGFSSCAQLHGLYTSLVLHKVLIPM